MGGMARAAVGGLGVGQEWVDVKLSRARDTAYLNATGRPIAVAISCINQGSEANPLFSVSSDNVSFVNLPTGSVGTPSNSSAMVFIVQNGMYYKSAYLGTLSAWMELR